jgi:hypothetical protein
VPNPTLRLNRLWIVFLSFFRRPIVTYRRTKNTARAGQRLQPRWAERSSRNILTWLFPFALGGRRTSRRCTGLLGKSTCIPEGVHAPWASPACVRLEGRNERKFRQDTSPPRESAPDKFVDWGRRSIVSPAYSMPSMKLGGKRNSPNHRRANCATPSAELWHLFSSLPADDVPWQLVMEALA